MICATCLNIVMFVLSQTMIIFSEFPVNIWVALFVVCALIIIYNLLIYSAPFSMEMIKGALHIQY